RSRDRGSSRMMSHPSIRVLFMPARKPRRSAPPVRVTLGVDEAGRGPAVGPMVMAAVALDSKAAAALTRAGLTDSKSYGAGEDAHDLRCKLDALIRTRAQFVVTI